MKVLGLDIGTTTVSAVVLENGVVLDSRTLKNDAFLTAAHPWERLQSPARIYETAQRAVNELLQEHPQVQRIGLTGQMHGIVYLDRDGEPVSPLSIWQDERGDQPYDTHETYAQRFARLTGYPAATGYGLVTHYYNVENGLVPENAAIFCTIHDYIAMKLAGRTVPLTEASDAASFGCFDLKRNCFDTAALQKVGISPALLPALAADAFLGTGASGIPVYVAIGDNQASFLGSTDGESGCMLVNCGTGSQFSVHSDTLLENTVLEVRPFPAGGYLLVGASLCGGRAYALLEQFFRQCAEMVTGEALGSCYDAMAQLMQLHPAPTDLPQLTPLFQGTRRNPALRGSITGLSTDNFTPQHLLYAMLHGMNRELFEMYESYLNAGGAPARLLGSGNALRKNPQLCRDLETQFGQALTLTNRPEEAACGAALFAATR